MTRQLKIVLSGGGTGGHIFPAIAVADEIRRRFPDAEILFIGANGKMEMEKIPQAGYAIQGIDISGIDRGNMLSNFGLPFKLLKSVLRTRKILKDFRPDFAVGTGGFASGPALFTASRLGIPVFIQEQNSHAGITNRILSGKAKKVFTAYPNVNGFPPEKTVFTGNPVRQTIVNGLTDTRIAKGKMGLDPNKLTILSVGGSLGSATLNNAWKVNIGKLVANDFQLIWQTGKSCYSDLQNDEQLSKLSGAQVQMHEFIADMALAYSAADVIVSRAGAIAISELAIAGKPVLLVPFPFAAEDHQTKNAQSLVNMNAAKMVKDSEMNSLFWSTLLELCEKPELRVQMSKNMTAFSKPEATVQIVDEIFKTLKV